MDEYNRLLERLNSFLSYEEVINNSEVISAYDYINLLRKEYNKSKKVSVSEELVSENEKNILKRIPVNVRDLPPLGLKVTERYTQAHRQMRLNKRMYSY